MKLLLIIVINFTILFGFCSKESIQKSKNFINLAQKANTTNQQVTYLTKAINQCYSYEADFNLQYLKASTAKKSEKKIKYYKKALLALSHIKHKKTKKIQYLIYLNLSKLYKNKNPTISKVYLQKAQFFKQNKSKTNNFSIYIVVIISLLILYKLIKVIKDY